MTHDVFISYSTKDKTIADAVCAKLEENKIRAWIAPRDVPAGANFAQSIIRAINTCQVFVLVWSANTNTSNHILNEINQAFDRGITIIPFRIQDIQPTDEMRYYFGRTHWLDAITPPLENHIKTLSDTILVNIGRELPTSAPTPVLKQSPEEITRPAVQLREEKRPVIEKSKAVKPSAISPPREKIRKTSPESRPGMTASPNLTKYIPYAAGGLALLTLGILFLAGVFNGTPPAAIAETLPSQTATITPTKTTRPTATATPVPAWVEEANTLAAPILAAVNELPPDFEDDFSQVDPGWDYWVGGGDICAEQPTPNLSIGDGVIKIFVDPDCHVRLDHPDLLLLSNNFVFQTDINFSPTTNVEIGVTSPNSTAMNFGINNSSWQISTQNQNSEDWKMVQVGGRHYNPSIVSLRLLKKDTTILFYLDLELLTSYEFQAEDADNLEFLFVVSDTQNIIRGPHEFDNIKYWDLDRLQ